MHNLSLLKTKIQDVDILTATPEYTKQFNTKYSRKKEKKKKKGHSVQPQRLSEGLTKVISMLDCYIGLHYTQQVLRWLCPLPVAVCSAAAVYTGTPVMLDCDQQREVGLKRRNFPVTDAQCGLQSGSAVNLCRHRSVRLPATASSETSWVQVPDGAAEVVPGQTGPLQTGGAVTHCSVALLKDRTVTFAKEVNNGCTRPLPWRWRPSRCAWILRWRPLERKGGRTSSRRTSDWAAGTEEKGHTVMVW